MFACIQVSCKIALIGEVIILSIILSVSCTLAIDALEKEIRFCGFEISARLFFHSYASGFAYTCPNVLSVITYQNLNSLSHLDAIHRRECFSRSNGIFDLAVCIVISDVMLKRYFEAW